MIDTTTNNSTPSVNNVPLTKSPFIPVADAPTATGITTDNPDQLSAMLSTLSPGDLVKRVRPWTSFASGDKFSRPASLDDLLRRLRANPRHFLANYLCFSIVLLVYCALTHWGFLFALGAIAGSFAWLQKQQPNNEDKIAMPFVGEPVSVRHLWWAWAAVSAVLCVVSGALTDIFWTVGVTVIIILIHGSLHIAEEGTMTDNLV